KTNLSTYNHIAVESGTARNATLSSNNGIFSDFGIVCDVYHIVEFHSFTDKRRTHGTSVNGGICANFYIVFHHYIAVLSYFAVSTVFLRCKSKTITANNYTGM